jgi:hypothetical protein
VNTVEYSIVPDGTLMLFNDPGLLFIRLVLVSALSVLKLCFSSVDPLSACEGISMLFNTIQQHFSGEANSATFL